MSYESSAEPIKLGYLFDFRLPEGFPPERRADLVQPFELVFDEGLKQGMIDRPVEIVFREVEGLPKGSAKAVIDGYVSVTPLHADMTAHRALDYVTGLSLGATSTTR